MKIILIPLFKLIRVVIDYVFFIPFLFFMLVFLKGLWDFKFKKHWLYFKDMDYIERDRCLITGKQVYYKTAYDYLIGNKKVRI